MHTPEQPNPSPGREAWAAIKTAIDDLRAANETADEKESAMGENEPFFEEQLSRIVARLEIFKYLPRAEMPIPDYLPEDSQVFIPANDQPEGIHVRVASDSDRRELSWRVVHEVENTTVFWECTLANSTQDGCFVALDQSAPPSELVDPDIIHQYLRFNLPYRGDVLSAMSPELTAIVTDLSGATVVEYGDQEDPEYPRMTVEEMRQMFYQPE